MPETLSPGSTIGILGGGQLGRMLALAAARLGLKSHIYSDEPNAPAFDVAAHHTVGSFDDEAALKAFAASVNVVTCEFENVPAEALERLSAWVRVRPPVAAVAIAQDRIEEKSFLERHGFATARFRAVRSSGELAAAVRTVGTPALLKTSRMGYDGKGQASVESPEEATAAFAELGGVPCVLEERLPLEREVSVVLARGDDGSVATFPVGENRHRDGILETTVVPARIPAALAGSALDLAGRVATALDYVGVLGVELFVATGGRLYVNELAPRPHNSGHYTLDACSTDQFEQQVRALCGLPLAEPRLLTPVAMVNLLGDLWTGGPPRWDEVFRRPGVRLHLYGKSEPRPGRKMGHLNCLADSADRALALALEARDALPVSPGR